MSRRTADSFDEDPDDRDADDDYEDDDWRDEDAAAEADDDEHESLRCPFCKASMYQDADICPKCGNFVTSDEMLGVDRKPWWRYPVVAFLVLTFASLIGVVLWAVAKVVFR